MRIAFISDTHNQLNKVVVPEVDMVIHCGDATNEGTKDELVNFNSDMGNLKAKYKIVISGNHDKLWEKDIQRAKSLATNYTYLQDELIEIEGIRIYGSPWTPKFGVGWAFNLQRGEAIKQMWTKIPDKVDILVTHGPPHMYRDATFYQQREGCGDLLTRVLQIKPKYHAFGHIHYSYGCAWNADTFFINAAACGEMYLPDNKPIVLNYDTGELEP